MEALSAAGFEWPSAYSAVDPLHDVYGIEVCGIVERDDVPKIRALLRRLLPDWHHGHVYFKEHGREPGWKVIIHRDIERPDEQWETA